MYGKANPAVQYAPIAASSIKLTGKKVAVFGGTDGIGREVAKFALSKGAQTTVIGRTFRDSNVPGLQFIKADFSLMSEAARVAESINSDLDIVVFTHGILADASRQVTAEGIEKDMAVSALSRHVLMKKLLPRLTKKDTARIFVMGMPGGGQSGILSDLNAERSYKSMTAHMNTVAANEALVHWWSSPRNATRKGYNVYGLNPGLLVTKIRTPVHGGGFLGGIMEWIISLFAPTLPQYAERVAALFVAPELASHPGTLFGQSGTAILPTPVFNDPAYTDKWMQGLDELELKTTGRAERS